MSLIPAHRQRLSPKHRRGDPPGLKTYGFGTCEVCGYGRCEVALSQCPGCDKLICGDCGKTDDHYRQLEVSWCKICWGKGRVARDVIRDTLKRVKREIAALEREWKRECKRK